MSSEPKIGEDLLRPFRGLHSALSPHVHSVVTRKKGEKEAVAEISSFNSWPYTVAA